MVRRGPQRQDEPNVTKKLLTREQLLAANEGVSAWEGQPTHAPAPWKIEALQGKMPKVSPIHQKATRVLYLVGVESRARVARETWSSRRMAVCQPRHGRASRAATNRRRRGSRRIAGVTRAGPDDPGESEPATESQRSLSRTPLRLWRHPKYGPCSPAMLRLLLARERAR
jgi:hypothetical protein